MQNIKKNPLLANDFKYSCCGKGIEEEGEAKCPH